MTGGCISSPARKFGPMCHLVRVLSESTSTSFDPHDLTIKGELKELIGQLDLLSSDRQIARYQQGDRTDRESEYSWEVVVSGMSPS